MSDITLPQERLEGILAREAEVNARLAQANTPDEMIALSREGAQLVPIADQIRRYQRALSDLQEARAMIEDNATDAEMRSFALEEKSRLEADLAALTQAIQIALLPKDLADDRSAILEVRAGTGGDEAALFAGDLLRMYVRYAELHGWKTELVSASDGLMGGYKEVIVEVQGEGVFARLKFEQGVHRVQRVPDTEASGRIHTSAATVAVLPLAEEVDVAINESDLRIDTMRAGGAGGQHVNKTESAVRITHIPTGIVVVVQDERSQHKNRAKAMSILRSRIFEAERMRLANARAAERKGQVGSGDRSERIRTYNFPQGRISDHRINLTLYKLEAVIEGGGLDEVIDALITDHQARLLAGDTA